MLSEPSFLVAGTTGMRYPAWLSLSEIWGAKSGQCLLPEGNSCLQPQSTPEPQPCKLLWDPSLQRAQTGCFQGSNEGSGLPTPWKRVPVPGLLVTLEVHRGSNLSLEPGPLRRESKATSLHGNRSPAVTKQPGSSLAGSGSPERLHRGGWNGPGWGSVEPLWEWLRAMDTGLAVRPSKTVTSMVAGKAHASHTRD